VKIAKRSLIAYAVLLAVLASLFLSLLPQRDVLDPFSLSRVVYDSSGNILRLSLSEDETFRLRISSSELSPLVKEAILFQEDRFFYLHPGVNPVSLVRAFHQSYIEGERLIGASTISMQLARMYYSLNTRTIPGKFVQIIRALYLDFFYTKEEILQAYLTLVPCGKNIEGFAAASIIYFGKSLEKLGLEEVLLLSVIPQSPFDRTPVPGGLNRELLEARERLYSRWVEEHPEDLRIEPVIKLSPDFTFQVPFEVPHFSTDILKNSDSDERIFTTIEPELQSLVEKHMNLYVARNREKGVRNASVMIVDRETMDVKVSVGSIDFFNEDIQGQVNGTAARRSPGSTLKPFIYGLAIDQGLIHPLTMLRDAPTSFSEYTPDNFRSEFKGVLSATEALTSSRNVPAVRLASKLEDPDLYDLMKKSGIPLKEKEHYGLSIVLGSAEVTMEELIYLYCALGNSGELYEINKTVSPIPEKKGVLFSPEAAHIIMKMLETNPPPGREKTKRDPVAYKTGTSIGFKDCWSVGLFDRFTIAIWIGNFDGEGNHSFLGRTMAAPLMFEIIDSIRENFPERPTEVKNEDLNIVETLVCKTSGLLPNENCSELITTSFIPGVSPIESCKIHRKIYVDRDTGFRVTEDHEKGDPQVWEFWSSDLYALYRQAGLPRKLPPPYDPDSGEAFAVLQEGFIPEKESPQSNIEYVIRINSREHRTVPLKASVDGDVKDIFWFIGNRYIGNCRPDEVLFWELEPGKRTVRVVDDKGRSNSLSLEVIMSE